MTDGEVRSQQGTNNSRQQLPSIKKKMGGVVGSKRMQEKVGEVGTRKKVAEALLLQLFQRDQSLKREKVWEVSARQIWRMDGATIAGEDTALEERLVHLQQTLGELSTEQSMMILVKVHVKAAYQSFFNFTY